MRNDRAKKAARYAAGLLLLTAALAACAQPPPAPGAAADAAVQGHAQWCGTNPPSGYCSIDDRR
jgi:hypothetical protein